MQKSTRARAHFVRKLPLGYWWDAAKADILAGAIVI
jgi:hypothetical protein